MSQTGRTSHGGRAFSWRTTIKAAIAVAAVWFLAVPQLRLAWSARSVVAIAQPALLGLAAVLAGAALLAYAQLMRTNLGDQTKPGLWHTLGIITTALGVSNITPGGSAVGSLVTFKMLQRAGVDRTRAAAAMAVTSIGSALVLNILLILGLLTILPTRGAATGVLACIPTTALLLAMAVLAQRVTAHDPRLWATARRLDRRLGIGSQPVTAFLDELATQFASWRLQPGRLARALGWATVNWLVDVAALWTVLFAVGQRLSPPAVLVAFSLANLAALVPLTPGGIGVVELTMTITLVGLGGAPAPVAAAVAIYRIFSYWTPIPASALSYLATRVLAAAPLTPEIGTIPVLSLSAVISAQEEPHGAVRRAR